MRPIHDRYPAPAPMRMDIPNGRAPVTAPPPLPPPRYVESDAHMDEDEGLPGGSYHLDDRGCGGGSLSHWTQRMAERKVPEQSEFQRRESARAAASYSQSPTDSERRYESMRMNDEGYYSLSGPSPVIQQSVYPALPLASSEASRWEANRAMLPLVVPLCC